MERMKTAMVRTTARASPVIFNNLTRSKMPLPSSPLITLYVCGPTVYDVPHLGHGRTYVLFDSMVRVMRSVFNKQVVFAMNITDVDDKILAKSKASNRTRQSVSKQYENEFFEEMKLLGVERPTIVPRATEYIQEMIEFIGKLQNRGYAYRTGDGSVYLDTTRAKKDIGYPGPLGGGRDIAAAHHEEQGQEKRNSSDFALWKSSAEQTLTPDNWDAKPFGGFGRPGWHLECSAMVDATLGKITGDGRIDLHGGGIDLCFPHHTNERCQSQLLLDDQGKDWSTVFCHTGHVTVNQTKMSKSLGNFSTIRSIVQSGELTPRQLRLLFLCSCKYSSGLEWNSGSIDKIRALDFQLDDALKPVSTSNSVSTSLSATRESLSSSDMQFIKHLAEIRENVDSAFADDFDFPKVFDELQKVAKELIKRSTTKTSVNEVDIEARRYMKSILEILGFGSETGVKPAYGVSTLLPCNTNSNVDLDAVLDELVRFRSKVRTAAKAGDIKGILQACDVLRNENPYASIQDLKDGTSVWKRKH